MNVAFEHGNFEEARRLLLRFCDGWREKPLQIAVIGSSGAGKSTLINAIRGISPGQLGAARTGIEAVSHKCIKYTLPGNDEYVLWDVPGVGTEGYPQNKYLEIIKFEMYDFFLICSCNRFTLDDLWLAKQIDKSSRHFYMLRTKVDIDMKNAHYDDPSADENTVRRILKKAIKGILKGNYPLFILSSREPKRWDFPIFMEKLVKEALDHKRKLIIALVKHHTQRVVREQKDKLSKTSKLHVAASIGMGLLPLPGLDLLVDRELLLDKVKTFQTQLGVTTKYLFTTGDRDLSPQEIEKLELEVGLEPVTADMVWDILIDHKNRRITRSILRVLPVLGQIGGAINAGIELDTMLDELLDIIASDAVKLAEFFGKNLANSIT